MKLEGNVAIITGAGRGLGRASAIEMAREGASLVILSRTTVEIETTSRMVEKVGAQVLSLKADISRATDIQKAVDKAHSHFGRIDILMNNAAVGGPVGPLHEIDEGDWTICMDINLKGYFLFSKAVIPHMMGQEKGKIINVTSGLGVMAMPLFGGYSIAKAGVIHLTRILAEELRDFNIQVNGLDPGVMDTKMQEELRNLGPEVLGNDIYAEFSGYKEKGILKPPERVAQLAVFLASEASDSITGENGTASHYTGIGYEG
jgi:NAD(P)-dependent dehydrogenase (short-subunit alcohol dehydrogenase family)